VEHKNLFDGIKVLAVARQIAAPFATYQLAMHGAEVLTVDNPKEIDSMRLVAGAGNALAQQAMSHSFMAQAANKKSMQLDLSLPKGQEIFRRLAAESDVIVENLVTGGMAKFGLSSDFLIRFRVRRLFQEARLAHFTRQQIAFGIIWTAD
jgi:crotonobetainyl-CoA:carnitine CoA-transferase CaiB-like acyl-CoA transferase